MITMTAIADGVNALCDDAEGGMRQRRRQSAPDRSAPISDGATRIDGPGRADNGPGAPTVGAWRRAADLTLALRRVMTSLNRHASGAAGFGVEQTRAWLALDARHATSRRAHRAHLAVVTGEAFLLVLGISVGYAGTASQDPARSAALIGGSPVLVLAAIAIHASERLVALLFNTPLPKERMRGSMFARHPILAFPMALVLHVITAASDGTLLALQSAASFWWLRGAVLVSVVCCAMPVALLVTHPIATVRAARTLRRTPARTAQGTAVRGGGAAHV